MANSGMLEKPKEAGEVANSLYGLIQAINKGKSGAYDFGYGT